VIQVRIHTSTHQYCHFADYPTRYWPVVGKAITRNLLAVLLNTAHSCSRHGLVAARFTSERPGSVIPLSKNIYCTGSAFIAAVTGDVCETDGKRMTVCALCLFTPAQTAKALESDRSLMALNKEPISVRLSLSLDSSTRTSRRVFDSLLTARLSGLATNRAPYTIRML
jgi:hypothetical protein